MRRIILLCFGFFFLSLHAQQVQWANEVLRVSSEFRHDNPLQFRAEQILGPPNIKSDFGASPCAWTPATKSSMTGEFIVVGFAEPQRVQQIIINENFNAGAISAVALLDEEDVFHSLSPNTYERKKGDEGVLNIMLSRTSYSVKGLRIDLNTPSVEGYNQIDAVGIADHQEPYAIKIRLAEDTDILSPPKNLGQPINSEAEELCPIISPDGKTLYFVRQDHPENIGFDTQDIWYAKLDENGQPGPPINMGRPLNNDQNTALTSITPDGQRALLLNVYLPDGDMSLGISMARRTAEGWGMPDSLAIKNYYNLNIHGEYSLSSTGRVMIMAIQRQEGLGAKDLFVSFRNDDGTWTKPKWMGPKLNSPDSETSPFLAADDQTLYFSTNGRPGYGAKDMFVTRRTGDSWLEWTEPENLGPVLNTPGWDAYYSVPASGDYVYFVSYQEDGYGKSDIYRAPLPKTLQPKPVVLVSGIVTNQKTGEPLGTNIEYTSLTTGESIGQAYSDPKTGAYSIVLPAGDLFGFSAAKEDFLPVSSSLDLRELDSYEEVRKDLELAPVEKGAQIVLNNIYFDTGKFDLRSESFVELKQMAAFMQKYPAMVVEIQGHTDDQGNDKDNLTLSDNRARAVVEFMVAQGVYEIRFVPKGYGEKEPAVPNSNAQNRQKNRRVEFRILNL